MKKILILLFVVSILALSLVFAAKPTEFDSTGVEKGWEKTADKCTTIQDGTLLGGDGSLLTTGYDEEGWNYQAHIFKGDNLMMKWNDAFISNTDCDGDGLLDRHYGFDNYTGSGAWFTVHQSGEYEQDGEICKWNSFMKIVAVPLSSEEKDGVWYTVDGTEIGLDIGGGFAIIQQVENDLCAGLNGLQFKSDAPTGFGFYKP